MASSNRRHLEFFGPDLVRTPPLSGSPPVAAVQIAAALAQMRVPLLRDDEQIAGHADFIRDLAERLLPDYAVNVRLDVGPKISTQVKTTIHVDSPSFTLLQCWLADERGGLVSEVEPTAVSWTLGTIVQTIVTKRHFLILVPENGVVEATVQATGPTYYWAVSRLGRVYYSSALNMSVL